MNFQVYPDASSNPSENFSQVVDTTGHIVQGQFMDYFSTSNFSSWSYYDDRLRDLLSQSAFISRYHTAQFRQLDTSIQFLLSFSTAPGNAETFSTSTDWADMLSNTMYMIANINTRMNLLNEGISSLFESSNYFSESTYTLNYLSETFWPRGATWSGQWVPASLTSNPLGFEEATYMGDAYEVDVARLTLTADFASVPFDTSGATAAEAYFTPDLGIDLSYTGQRIVEVSVTNLVSTVGAGDSDDMAYVDEIFINDSFSNDLYFDGPVLINDVNVGDFDESSAARITDLAYLSITSDFSLKFELRDAINPSIFPNYMIIKTKKDSNP